MESRFKHNQEGEERQNLYSPSSYLPSNTGTVCAQIHNALPEMMENDSSLKPEEVIAIQAHLTVCSSCAREYRQMQQIIIQLESVPLLEPPEDYSIQIEQKIFQSSLINKVDSNTILTQSLGTYTSECTLKRRDIFSGFMLLAPTLFLMLGGTGFTAWLNDFPALAAHWSAQVGSSLGSLPLLGGLLNPIFASVKMLCNSDMRLLSATDGYAMLGLTVNILLAAMLWNSLRVRKEIIYKWEV